MAAEKTLVVSIDLASVLPEPLRDYAPEYVVKVAEAIPRFFDDVSVMLVKGSRIWLKVGPRARLKPEYHELADKIIDWAGLPSVYKRLARKNQVWIGIIAIMGGFLMYSYVCTQMPNAPGCKEILALWGQMYEGLKLLIHVSIAAAIASAIAYAIKAWRG